MFSKDRKVNQFRARTILSFVRGPSVLELGCADGLVTAELVKAFERVTAVDSSEVLLAKARERAPTATYFCSLFELFQPVESFDTILLGHVLEHVEDPLRILRIAQGWLKSDGIMIITVPNGESIHRRLGVELGMLRFPHELNENDLQEGHRRVFTLGTLRELVAEAGLSILREEGVLLKPLSNQQMFTWPDATLEGLYRLGKKLQPDLCGELCIVCRRT